MAGFAGALIAALAGWLVMHFAPGVLARLVRRPPVLVHVELDPANMYAGMPNWVGSAWVLPDSISPESLGVPPTGVCRDWREWMWPMGAYDGWYTELRITLQGNVDSTVLVDGLRVNVLDRGAPSGHCFMCAVGGADIQPRSVNVDLDWSGVVTYSDSGGDPVGRFTFTLSKGEVETFHVRAEAKAVQCSWTADLLLIVNGERRTVHLDADGEPFRTSATEGLPAWTWYDGAAAWQGSRG